MSIATSVIMFARPSFTPWMGTNGGICASITNTMSETAVSIAIRASFLVLGIDAVPLDLNGHSVGHTNDRHAVIGDLALLYADLVTAV